MFHVTARVEKGRLILDEPTDLAEGSVVDLVPSDLDDALDDADQARLNVEIAISQAELRRGRGIPASEVIARLRARG